MQRWRHFVPRATAHAAVRRVQSVLVALVFFVAFVPERDRLDVLYYSARSAVSGFTRAARRAGTSAAAMVTAASTIMTSA